MSLSASLLRLALHCRRSWMRPQTCASALRPANAASGALPPPPPACSLTGGARCLASSSSGSRAAPQRTQSARPRRAVAAGAGRRGNVFLDDSPAGRRRGDGADDEEYSAAKLFDSSRFNYDSDEDEEGEQQAEQQEQAEQQAGPAAAGAQQQGTAASAAGAAAAQQRRRRAAQGEGAADGEGGAAEMVLPPPRATKVKSAEFVKSSVEVDQCPPAVYPEFAVIGRSNVGKSSLINLLTGRTSLAMVSKTPGKTRCINHFLINGAWHLVDLPGYGYARTSKGNVLEWSRFTREYFLERDTLVTVLLLVDASIPPMQLDVACATWLAEAEIPFTLVFTKLDKKKKGAPAAEDNIAAFEAAVAEAAGYAPPSILTSSKSGRGRGELLAHIAQLRDFWTAQQRRGL